MNPRRIILVNRFFSPDQSATSQLLSSLASRLAHDGNSVIVIATRGRYEDPGAKLSQLELIDGVQVHRTSHARFGRIRLLARALDILAIYFSFARALAQLSAPGDVVIVMTDPPLLAVALAPVAVVKRLVLVNWLQDLYPEIAVALRVGAAKLVAPLLVAARNATLRMARMNIVISERMRDRLLTLKTPPERVAVIANWCEDERITPIAAQENPLRAQWRLRGKFVVGYSGNLGRAHEFQTLIEAADDLRDERDILFVFIGEGYLTPFLKQEVARRELGEKFRFLELQDSQALPLSLTVPDIHWLSLPDDMEGLLLPSKLYGIAAAGRPIVAVADPLGEIGALITRHECGVAIFPRDHMGLAKSIRAYRDDPLLLARHGRAARKMLDANFRKELALNRWTRTIADV